MLGVSILPRLGCVMHGSKFRRANSRCSQNHRWTSTGTWPPWHQHEKRRIAASNVADRSSRWFMRIETAGSGSSRHAGHEEMNKGEPEPQPSPWRMFKQPDGLVLIAVCDCCDAPFHLRNGVGQIHKFLGNHPVNHDGLRQRPTRMQAGSWPSPAAYGADSEQLTWSLHRMLGFSDHK